jgi:hypothetical protein
MGAILAVKKDNKVAGKKDSKVFLMVAQLVDFLGIEMVA